MQKYNVIKLPEKQPYTLLVKAESLALINSEQKEIYSLNPYNTFSYKDNMLTITHPLYSICLQCSDPSSAAHLYSMLLTNQNAITTRIQKYTYILQNGCHFIFSYNQIKERKLVWLDDTTNQLCIGKNKYCKNSICLKSISFMKFIVTSEAEKIHFIIQLSINGMKAELITLDYNKLKITYMALQDALQRSCNWQGHLTTIDLSFRKMSQILTMMPKGRITDKMVDIFESDASNENTNDLNVMMTSRHSPDSFKETTKLNLSKLSCINPKSLLESKSLTRRSRVKHGEYEETERSYNSVYY